MRSREVIELMTADGWYEVAVKGSHHQFRHPNKTGRVTVPHPKTEIPKGTLHNILKSAGLKGAAFSDESGDNRFPSGRGIQ
ncbi:type II toxin-antitoxin system HicA family toxin [Pseudomonas gingeri]|uniref:type II toxin-antitoxin system HicA family toxin n=1 Tax=Pseudomonas gingeri TaxID=117681 RepID=UPI0015A4BE9D|nr:type II toxin-antitoxin system HicA family toxin [Pseudomonas gingeri]NWE49128.1 type II toxin-antitoxin system HicA family toxin [Pseudomonas gingeri]